MKKKKLTVLGLALGLGIAATIAIASSFAQAASTNSCIVEIIGYDGSPRLAVWCSNSEKIHYAFGTNWSDCKNAGLTVSMDTIKIWHNMLQSALLSGRKVDLDYNVKAGCQRGVRVISAIRLHRQ